MPEYHWLAGMIVLGSVIAMSIVGKKLAFLVPAFQDMLALNRAQDRVKRAQEKYPPIIAANNRIGLATNVLFFIAIVPFITHLQPTGLARITLELVGVLMIYDFVYYLTHRFLFHGQGYFRKVHALHHQARSPTHVDAFYVHPLETVIGIALFMGTATIIALVVGGLHAASLALSYLVFVQLNTLNHCHVDLPRFPYRTLSWISAKHAVHHENMHKGNYATITLLYDKMFGTLD